MTHVKYNIGGSFVIGNIMEDVEDVNPREYFLHFHAKSIIPLFIEILTKEGVPIVGRIPEMIYQTAYDIAEEQMRHSESLELPEPLKKLLTEDLKKKEQVSLLKGVSIETEQLATLFIFAGVQGYSLSQYRFEGVPGKYATAELPSFIHLLEDGSVEHTGKTELSDGQMKEVVETSSFVIARILKKDSHWHCFYQTKNGVSGQEPGVFGGLSHFHYVSDSFGLNLEDVIKGFKSGICPHSKVHLILEEKSKDAQEI